MCCVTVYCYGVEAGGMARERLGRSAQRRVFSQAMLRTCTNAADEEDMGNDVCDFEGHRCRRPHYAGTLYVQGYEYDIVVAIMGWRLSPICSHQ